MEKKKVVICDDENTMLQVVQDVTNHLGLISESFANGKLALEQILKSPPDLVISDVNMPEMTGIELLKNLKEKNIKVPVIFLTGSLEKTHFLEAMANGYFDYLNKPLAPFELIEAIEKAFSFGYQEPADSKTNELLMLNKKTSIDS